MNPRIILPALILAAATTTTAQTTQRLTATKQGDYGIVYSLPSTVVDITIEAELKVSEPGEFYRYAKRYLNIDNPITSTSHSATVKSVKITTHGVANTDERYLLTLKSGFAPYMELTADNLPLSVNIEGIIPATPDLPVAHAADPTPLQTSAARQVITEEMLQSNSSAKRAELAAAQIYALRQSRTDIITGQAENMPPDGRAMELVLSNIDAQEAALVAMFVGTTATSTQVTTICYDPQDTDATNEVIARLSSTKGLVAPTDLSGAPIYMSIKTVQRGEMPTNDKGVELTMPKGAMAYCIPGTAEVAVSYDGRTLADEKIKLSQAGVIYGIAPSSLTDKKMPMYFRFDPATGALVESGQAPLK